MDIEAQAVAEWPGWSLRRRSSRAWWVFRGDAWMAEVGVLGTGEWWVCPDGDTLPWAATFPTLREAVGALATWWTHTHPFEGP